MTFYQAIRSGIKAKITGRASRSEYWHFHLFLGLLGVGLSFIFVTNIAVLGLFSIESSIPFIIATISVAIIGLYGAAAIYALIIRRLHDTGRSGWYLLLALLPFYSIFILYLLLFKKGDSGLNKYGSDPIDSNFRIKGLTDPSSKVEGVSNYP